MTATRRLFQTSEGVAGAMASALLLTLALPPFSLFPLSFLALVPIALAISGLPAGPGGRRSAAALGGLFGLGFWAWSLIWIPTVVGPRFPWAFPGYLLQLVLLSGLTACFAWGTHTLHRDARLPLGLALPLAWVGVEWLKGHFPFGLAFPWMGLGVSLSEWPTLLGIAEWVGESGVAFWLAGSAGTVAALFRCELRGRRWDLWLIAGLVALVPAAAGMVRARTLHLVDGPRVLVVGTQVPPSLRVDSLRGAEPSLGQVQEALQVAPPGPWDLILLPEGAVPLVIGEPEWDAAVESLHTAAAELGSSLAFGTVGRARNGSGDGPTNSAVLVSSGTPGVQRYDKVRLVPGMEAGVYFPGSGDRLLSATGWDYGPLVCYESIYSRSARRARKAGAVVLVNLTSDVWFGHPGSLVGALFLRQHPAHLVLRAVETRTSVARAANGGYSLLLDPRGQLVNGPQPPGVGVIGGQLPVFSGRTLFSRTGDWVGPSAILLSFLIFWVRGRKGLSRTAPEVRPGSGSQAPG